MKKSIVVASILLLLVAASLFLASREEQVDPRHEITLLDGSKTSFGQLQGKPLLVVFWATSCTTCVQEMPKLAELHKQGKAEILAVAMQYDDETSIRNFIRENGYSFKFTWDKDRRISQMFENTVLTPTIYQIDKDGYIKAKYVGKVEFS